MTVKEAFRKNLNVPNVLSFIRLMMVPVYIVLFVQGKKYPALIVFLAACLTDLLDGYIARKYQLITDLGKLLDPFADKVMVLTAMFSMAIGNAAIPPVIPWAAVIVLLFKELAMVAGGLFMLKNGIVVYSNIVGKTAHCIFIAGLTLSYFHDWFLTVCPGWFATPDQLVVWLAVAVTLCALIVYAVTSVRQVRRKRTAQRRQES